MSAITDVVEQIVPPSAKQVVVAPLVWYPSDGTSAKRWQFAVVSDDPEPTEDRTYFVSGITVDGDQALGEQMRGSIVMALALRRPPLVIHSCDD